MTENSSATVLAGFRDYLHAGGLARTGQRSTIMEVIASSGPHFDAEDVLARVRRRSVRASRATVYRTISRLEQGGLIRKVDLDQDHAHYEVAVQKEHHEHMVCRDCGAIVEFADRELEEQLAAAAKKKGFIITDHRIQAFGFCKACADKKEAS